MASSTLEFYGETGWAVLETSHQQKQEKSDFFSESLTDQEITTVIQKKKANRNRDEHVEPKNCTKIGSREIGLPVNI